MAHESCKSQIAVLEMPSAFQCRYTVLNHVLYLRQINDHLNLLLLVHS